MIVIHEMLRLFMLGLPRGLHPYVSPAYVSPALHR